jgi:deoxycytidine triphosphate deaminase
MLLSDGELLEAIDAKRLVFKPKLERTAIQAASIDLTLNDVFWRPELPAGDGIDIVVDAADAEAYAYANQFKAKEVLLKPREFILGETYEKIGLADDLGALIEGKSGRARHGLIVHCTAPHIAPGWGFDPPDANGVKKANPRRVTLEIVNLGHATLRLRARTPIAQLLLIPTGKRSTAPYAGKHAVAGTNK